jgi:hypothetical protein
VYTSVGPMNRSRFLDALVRQRLYCEGRSPLYSAILRTLEADARARAAWLSSTLAAWKGRTFAVDWEAPHLLLACMHAWALGGRAPELAAVYPSCGGSGPPGAAASAFLRRAGPAFWDGLRVNLMQTNEVDRGLIWMMVAAPAFRSRDLPFHLVELGASAGLSLIGDHLPPPCWSGRPGRVLSRTGLDVAPRRLADPRDYLWLKACVWADDLERLARLERAAGLFLRLEERREGPSLVRCGLSDAPEWLRARRRPRDGEGLIVFNCSSTAFLRDDDYARLRRGMIRALAPWGRRALWAEFELPRGARAGRHELSVHRVAGTRLHTRVLAAMAADPKEARLPEGWERRWDPLIS